MDRNGDGTVDFEEFSYWWHRDNVTYTLKRSEAIPPVKHLLGRGEGVANGGGDK